MGVEGGTDRRIGRQKDEARGARVGRILLPAGFLKGKGGDLGVWAGLRGAELASPGEPRGGDFAESNQTSASKEWKGEEGGNEEELFGHV